MRCPSCDRESRPDARFCDGCGSPLERTGEPAGYTPAHLVDRILRSRAGLEGERKQVTVLFADVKGSMDLSEPLDPEDWRRILDRFYEILLGGVHRFEGIVVQFTGDGIMAVFGAPVAHEDHAHRACFAALQLRDALGAYAGQLRRERGLSFSVRMGLNSGEVVVGAVGDDLRMEYAAVGYTVGLAQRMEALAEPGHVYLTEATASLVQGYFDVAGLGSFEVKGASEPVRVFELVGLGEHRTRLEVARERGFSRFVGRREELGLLRDALDAADAGRGRVVAVVGDAGVGKSRLCNETLTLARASGIKVFEAYAVTQGRSLPFLPILQLLRGYFGIESQDGPVATRQKIAGSLLLLDEGFRDSLQLVFDFLGVPDPDLPHPQVDPEARLVRLAGVIADLVRARSARGPALLLIEDLQWIDEGSEAFVRHLVDTVGETRTLLLVNTRPEYAAPWMRSDAVTRIALAPLGPAEIAELLDDLVGPDPSLDDLKRLLADRSAGNPFFAEELVRSLAAEGVLDGTRGDHRLARAVPHLRIPATVEAVLAARIDGLANRDKELLQTAAVIGKTFTLPMLQRITGLSETDLENTLRRLSEATFVQEGTSLGDREFAFEHPLTQEIAYRTQLATRRSRVHASVADAIETVDAERLDERAALLAQHRELAGDRASAARWERRAAEWTGQTDAGAALRHWWKVREHVAVLDPSPETETLALASCIGIMNLGSRVGLGPEQAAALYEQGHDLATARSDDRSLARLLLVHARLRGQVGEISEAVELSREAARVAEHTGWSGLRLAACVNISAWLWQLGEVTESLRVIDEASAEVPKNLKIGSEHLGFSPYVWLLMQRGRILPFLGRCPDAYEACERATRLAREQDEPEILCWAHQGHVDLAWVTGDADAAITHARAALEGAERIGTSAIRWSSYAAWGRALLVRGSPDAVAAYERSLGIIRETQTGLHGEIVVLAGLADACLGAGDGDRAIGVAREAVELSRRHPQRPGGIQARLAAARTLRETHGSGVGEEVEAMLSEAEAMLAKEDARFLEPATLVERAGLARLDGDETAARRHLDEARRLYEEIGAPRRARALAAATG